MLLQYKDEPKKRRPIPILVKLLKVDRQEKDYYNYTNSHMNLLSICQPTNFNITFQKPPLEINIMIDKKFPSMILNVTIIGLKQCIFHCTNIIVFDINIGYLYLWPKIYY